MNRIINRKSNWPFGPQFLLATGYYEPAKLVPEIIYPRPDTETNSDAYCRNAYPGVRWEISIDVQGGAWPFLYEIVIGPAGMVIGETLTESEDTLVVGADYGVLSWDSPTLGAHPIEVRVTDQDGTVKTRSWTLVVGTSNWIFVDATATDDTGTGLISDPLKTFNQGVYGGSDTDSTYLGKLIYFRAGSYTINNGTANVNAVLDPTYKPRAYVAYPGESVTFDTSTGHIFTSTSGMPDLYIAGIDYNGSRSDTNNNRIHQIGGNAARIKFYKNTFDNITPGILGSDNPACVMSTGLANDKRDHIIISRCSIGTTCQVQLGCFFNCSYVLTEHNNGDGATVSAGNGRYFLQGKDDVSNITIRANSAINFSGGDDVSPFAFINQSTMTLPADSNFNQEICFNVAEFSPSRAIDSSMKWNSQTSGYSDESYDYRNCWVCDIGRAVQFYTNTGVAPWFGKNAIAGGGADIFGTHYTDGGNQLLDVTDFDVDGKLTGTARTNHLGLYGNEIKPVYR